MVSKFLIGFFLIGLIGGHPTNVRYDHDSHFSHINLNYPNQGLNTISSPTIFTSSPYNSVPVSVIPQGYPLVSQPQIYN